MARVIKLSRAALVDIDSIYDLIAEHNSRAAAKVLRGLDAAIQLLVEQPRMGKAYRHGRLQLRVLIHDDYLIFYREQTSLIEVVRVLHGKQNIPDILDEL